MLDASKLKEHLLWKIGITNRSVKDRFSGSVARKIRIIKVWKYDLLLNALNREKKILRKYSDDVYMGKDQPLSKGGNTELFTRDVLGLDPEFS